MASNVPEEMESEASGDTVPKLDPLNVLFVKLSKKLDESDVENIKLLLHDSIISRSDDKRLNTATECFHHLRAKGFISERNLSLLIQIFKQLEMKNLISMVLDFMELPAALTTSDGHNDFVNCNRKLRERYEKYATTKPFPWSDFTMSDDTNVRLLLETSLKDIQIDNLFTTRTGLNSARRIFIKGKQGYGKSVICRKLAYDWAVAKKGNPLEDCKMVFLLQIRKTDQSLEEAIFRSLASDMTIVYREQFWTDIQTAQESVCFLIDGFYDTLQNKESDVHKLLTGSLLTSSKVVVTSRKLQLQSGSNLHNYDNFFKLMGLSEIKRQEYIDGLNWSKATVNQNLLSKIKTSIFFNDIKENPRDFPLLFEVITSQNLKPPSTKSNLYEMAFESFFDSEQISNYLYRFGKHVASIWFQSNESLELQDDNPPDESMLGFENLDKYISGDLTLNEFSMAKYLTRLLHENRELYKHYFKLLIENINYFSQVITFQVGLSGKDACYVFEEISNNASEEIVSFEFIFQLLQECDHYSYDLSPKCAVLLPERLRIDLPLNPCFDSELVRAVLGEVQLTTKEIDLSFNINETTGKAVGPEELAEGCKILDSYQNQVNITFSESIYSHFNVDTITRFFAMLPDYLMSKTKKISFLLRDLSTGNEEQQFEEQNKLISSIMSLNLTNKFLNECYVKNVVYKMDTPSKICILLPRVATITLDMCIIERYMNIFKNTRTACDRLKSDESFVKSIKKCVTSTKINAEEGKYTLTCQARSDKLKLYSVDFCNVKMDDVSHFQNFIGTHDGIEELTLDGCDASLGALASILELRNKTLKKLVLRPRLNSLLLENEEDNDLFSEKVSKIEPLQYLYLRDFRLRVHEIKIKESPWRRLMLNENLTEIHMYNCFSDSVSTMSMDINPIIAGLVEKKQRKQKSNGLTFTLWCNTLTYGDIRQLIQAGLISCQESVGQLYGCTVSSASLKLLKDHEFDVSGFIAKNT